VARPRPAGPRLRALRAARGRAPRGPARGAALEQLLEARLALGHHVELVGQLEALIAEHAYRERRRSQLMLALYRSERQAHALAGLRRSRAARSWAAHASWAERSAGLDDAFASRARMFLIVGEPGMGKTPLGRGAERMPAPVARGYWLAATGRRAAPPPTGPGCSRCAPMSARQSPTPAGRTRRGGR